MYMSDIEMLVNDVSSALVHCIHRRYLCLTVPSHSLLQIRLNLAVL